MWKGRCSRPVLFSVLWQGLKGKMYELLFTTERLFYLSKIQSAQQFSLPPHFIPQRGFLLLSCANWP